MSDVPAATAPGAPAYVSTFEQKLFEWSPAGTLVTSLGIFLVLITSFEVLAALTGYPLAAQLSFSPREGAWPAVILSLLATVALGMQRYTRLKDVADAPALARLIACDVPDLVADPAVLRRIRTAGTIGAVIGFAISFIAVPPYVVYSHIPVFIWFASLMAFLGAMFARGAVMTRTAARNFSRRVDHELKIDLLRVDELSIIGRSSARAALIWLSVAAVISLFFVSGHAQGLVIATVIFAAGMAFWIFFRSLERVHRRIVTAKRAELERLRHAIHDARLQAVHDHAAATRLQGLLAYESRIEHVHEWPFDQLTLLRVGAYVLIPALPAAGQMAFKLFSEHVAL